MDDRAARIAQLVAWSREAAQEFRALANDWGVYLDYSPESLDDVERLIRARLTGRGEKPKRRFRDLAGATGAYVSEVIVRNLGGRWAWNEELDVGGLRLPSGAFTAPLAKSRKRFDDGEGDDLAAYYRALADYERSASRA